MTEKEFLFHFGHTIRVKCKDNTIIEGFCNSYTWGEDNENGEASITINTEELGLIEVSQSEVSSIEILK